jgi:hypothetical protein
VCALYHRYDITLDAFGIEDIIPISEDRFAINPSLMGIAPEGGRVIERIMAKRL